MFWQEQRQEDTAAWTRQMVAGVNRRGCTELCFSSCSWVGWKKRKGRIKKQLRWSLSNREDGGSMQVAQEDEVWGP